MKSLAPTSLPVRELDQVGHWMSREPEVIASHETALDAYDRMLELGIRHLPVIGVEGKLVGIVSSDDLRAALPFDIARERELRPGERAIAGEHALRDVMTYFLETVRAETPLEEAVRMLAEQHIGCLPVVDAHGKLVGMFTETDALRALAHLLRPGGGPSGGPAWPPPPAAEHMLEELRAERARIAQRLDQLQVDERSLGAQQHDEPNGGSDRGALQSARATTGALADSAARRIAEIDRALERAQQRALGRCVQCDRSIPLGRLRALPGTDRCIRCARTDHPTAEETMP